MKTKTMKVLKVLAICVIAFFILRRVSMWIPVGNITLYDYIELHRCWLILYMEGYCG